MRELVNFSVFILLMSLFSCSENREAKALFDRVDSLMDEYPDSALMLLDSVSDASRDYSHSQKMRYELLRAKAMNKAYVDFTSDSVMKEVVEYYDHKGTANERVEAHYLLGCVYRDLHEAPMALNCYYDAVECADTLSDDCNYRMLMRVYGQMADVLEDQLLSEEALEAWEKYSWCGMREGNIYNYIKGKELQIFAYSMMGDTLSVLSLTHTVHDLYKKYGFSFEAASVYIPEIYLRLDRHEYEKANDLIEIYEKESELFCKDGNIAKGKEHYYDIKVAYYSGVNQTDSAKLYCKKALQHHKSFDIYRDLIKVYKNEGQFDSAFYYLNLYEEELSTNLADVQTQAMVQAKEMYDYTRNQKIANQNKKLADRNRNIIYVLTLMFVIVAAVSFSIHSRYKSMKKIEMEALNIRFLKVSEQYETTKKDLAQIGEDYSEFRRAKEEELSTLKQQLANINLQYNNLKNKDKLDALKNSSVFHSIKNKLDPRQKDYLVLDKEWDELILLASQCLPMFYSRITSENLLSKQELQVTILTKLGFTSSDISLLLDKPAQRITNAKARSNSKLFGDNSARTFFVNIETL